MSSPEGAMIVFPRAARFSQLTQGHSMRVVSDVI